MAKKQPEVTHLERTGDRTFNAHLEDGSHAELTHDPSKVRLKGEGFHDIGDRSKYHFAEHLRVGNLMSNADRRRIGSPQDDALPDYQPEIKQ